MDRWPSPPKERGPSPFRLHHWPERPRIVRLDGSIEDTDRRTAP